MKKLIAIAALTILTACDYAARKDVRAERDDRAYRAAMDDYRAGRMDAAIAGLEKAVRNDPANASARFQLTKSDVPLFATRSSHWRFFSHGTSPSATSPTQSPSPR